MPLWLTLAAKFPLRGTQIINSVLMLLFLNQDFYRIPSTFNLHFIKLQKGNYFELSSLLLQGEILLAKQHTGHLCFHRVMPVFPSFRHEKGEKNPCSLLVLDHLCAVMDLSGCLQQLWGQFALGVGTASQKPGPPSSKNLKLCNQVFQLQQLHQGNRGKRKLNVEKRQTWKYHPCSLVNFYYSLSV